MKKIILAFLCGVIPYLLAGCGSDQHDGSPNTNSGFITFQLSWDSSSRSPQLSKTLAPATDVCVDYGVTTINASVINASEQTVATASEDCFEHSMIISGVPVGTVSVVIEGIVGTTVAWRGQATGINVVAGQTANAGTIPMTYEGSDHTPPTVQSPNPADEATGVSLGTSVSAVFSEPVVTASVNPSTFTLTCSTTTITGTVVYDSSTRTATFDPSSLLPASSNCTATITTGVEDLAGNHLAPDYPWSFTTGTAPISPPAAPTGLTATAESSSNIRLSWTDNSDNETGFKIERSSTSASTGFEEIAITGANVISYNSTSLSPSTTYWYQIRAYNSAGNSAYSNVDNATTQALPIPSAPTGVSAIGGNSQATISWTASSGTVSSYTVYYSTTDPVTTASPTKVMGITGTSTIITGLANGTAYFFIVTAVNPSGESAASTPQVWAIPGVTAGVNWTIRTSGTTDNLYAITSSNYQYVAVGGNSTTYQDTILTSPDGSAWTIRTTGNTNTWLYGITWSGSQFVAVGQNGAIFTSPDAITWTRHLTGNTSFLESIVWSGSQFVAVGANGTILTSPDGNTWTSRTSGTTNYLESIVWSGTQFVAVGVNGTILTSPNGITWTSRAYATNTLLGIAWSGTQFVAVGVNGTILTSPDGVTWANRTSGTTNILRSIVWSGTQLVAVGSGGKILASPNGVTWTSRTSGTTDDLWGVDWRGRFVAVGWNGRILTSQ
jgi:hypothetical protein